MCELKKNGKVFTSKSVGTGPSSYEKRIYRAVVSQRLRNTAIEGNLMKSPRQETTVLWARTLYSAFRFYFRKLLMFWSECPVNFSSHVKTNRTIKIPGKKRHKKVGYVISLVSHCILITSLPIATSLWHFVLFNRVPDSPLAFLTFPSLFQHKCTL